jgi:hypothetical protein
MNVRWRKSSHSSGVNDEDCVELGRLAPEAGVRVRDSRDPDGGQLTLTTAQFAGLLDRIKQNSERQP